LLDKSTLSNVLGTTPADQLATEIDPFACLPTVQSRALIIICHVHTTELVTVYW